MKSQRKRDWGFAGLAAILFIFTLPACRSLSTDFIDEYSPLTQSLPFMVRIDDKDGVFRGTGFIVSKSGLILTVSHVVRYRDPIYTVVNGKEYLAETVFDDPILDITLIRLINNQELPAVEYPCLLESDAMRNGDVVMVLGQRQEGSVALVPGFLVSWASFRIWPGTYQEVFRIHPSNSRNVPKPGFSGGPIFNIQKHVIGLFCCLENFDHHFYNGIPSKRIISRLKETEWVDELCIVQEDAPFPLPGFIFDINKI